MATNKKTLKQLNTWTDDIATGSRELDRMIDLYDDFDNIYDYVSPSDYADPDYDHTNFTDQVKDQLHTVQRMAAKLKDRANALWDNHYKFAYEAEKLDYMLRWRDTP